ncbi:YcgJ family protein [Aeromonas allosaccharophila]|uniref:YcgJ family protein n=1 Tax=Aeromonas allosaccharophila TaxID=656 RepID=UPI002ADFD690|nr:YcgJ family protein [Aeromonas allosaccharophila]
MQKKSVVFAVLFFSGLAQAAPAIFSPESGVLCDKKAGFCADSQGISMGLTRIHLGDKAKAKLVKTFGSIDGVDMGSYTLSNNVHCESSEKQCYQDRYFPRTKESKYSAMLFKQGK